MNMQAHEDSVAAVSALLVLDEGLCCSCGCSACAQAAMHIIVNRQMNNLLVGQWDDAG